jgi:hypothetical protein
MCNVEAMRSLGWTHCRLSRRPGVGRAWGWMKVNYNIPAPAGSMERDEAELLRGKAAGGQNLKFGPHADGAEPT